MKFIVLRMRASDGKLKVSCLMTQFAAFLLVVLLFCKKHGILSSLSGFDCNLFVELTFSVLIQSF